MIICKYQRDAMMIMLMFLILMVKASKKVFILSKKCTQKVESKRIKCTPKSILKNGNKEELMPLSIDPLKWASLNLSTHQVEFSSFIVFAASLQTCTCSALAPLPLCFLLSCLKLKHSHPHGLDYEHKK